MAESVPPPPILPPLVAPPVMASQPAPISPPPVIERPGVLTAFRWWCALFVCLYAGMTIYGVLVAQGKVAPSLGLIESAVSRNDQALREKLIAEKRTKAAEVAVFTAIVAIVYGAAAGLPRKPWAWIFGLLVLASTIFPFVITAAGAVPLLVYWAKPNVKRYFGLRA